MPPQDEIDITKMIPLRMYSSYHYLPFWLLTLSKFLLFLTHNMITALATTLYGTTGSISMTLMYIFFILGNFVAPLTMSWVKQDVTLLMLLTSFIYTGFAIVAAFVTISTNIDPISLSTTTTTTTTELTTQLTTSILSPTTIQIIFFIASSICGIAGGAIWIGYGVLNITLGEVISQRLFDEYLDSNLLDVQEQPEAVLDQLRQAVTGKIMSVGWSLLSFNTVIGGLLTFWILHSTTEVKSNFQLLFILFVIISILANVSYFALYRLRHTDFNSNGNDNNSNQQDKQSLEMISPLLQSSSPSSSPTLIALLSAENSNTVPGMIDDNEQMTSVQETSILLHRNVQSKNNNNENNIQNNTNNKYGSMNNDDHESQDIYNNNDEETISQWSIFTDLMKTRYILLSIIQYIFSGCAFNFLFASFMSNTVKNSIGVSNAPLIITIAYTTNTIASFFIGEFISTHKKARYMSIIGNIIQLIPLLLPIITPPQHDHHFDAWCFTLFVGGIAGIGDAIHSSALMTTMASDLKTDLDLGGQRYINQSELMMKELKGIVYSIYSATKSIGVFMMFGMSGSLEYSTQCELILFMGILSIIAQIFLQRRLNQCRIEHDGY